MADAVTLTIGGAIYGGWTSVDIQSSLDCVASSFSLGVTERWPGHPDRWTISAGAPAVVSIGGDPVITGYVDRLESEIDGESHHITVSGRSKAGDLADCSALNSPGSWSNRSLLSIAGEIAAPFGIGVSADTSTGANFKKFALQQGETAWDAIERMLRQRGLIAMSTTTGDVLVTTPTDAPAELTIEEGRDPVSVHGCFDVSERFSQYIAKGQAAGSDEASGTVVAGPKGTAVDPATTRYRPLIVIAEDQATAASLKTRAQFEATTRAARAQEADFTIAGTWRRADGKLWLPLQHIRLVAASAWIDATLMVGSVHYLEDEAGRRVEVKVTPPEAYSQLAIPDDTKSSSDLARRKTTSLRRRA